MGPDVVADNDKAKSGSGTMAEQAWGRVRNELLKELGKNNYVTWIEPLEFSHLMGGVAHFNVPTNFMGNWVARNFSDQIRQQFSAAGQDVNRLEFTVPAAVASVAERPVKAATTRRNGATGDGDLPGASLDTRFTFDSFVVGKPNELAHAAARRVAEGGTATFNPLFLYGGVGLGKTHLMHAIAWELQNRSPDMRVLYLSAEQFMYRFVQALREKAMACIRWVLPRPTPP